jgi:hypothetical protein
VQPTRSSVRETGTRPELGEPIVIEPTNIKRAPHRTVPKGRGPRLIRHANADLRFGPCCLSPDKRHTQDWHTECSLLGAPCARLELTRNSWYAQRRGIRSVLHTSDYKLASHSRENVPFPEKFREGLGTVMVCSFCLYNAHNSGNYPSSSLLCKMQLYWTLSPSACQTYLVGPNRQR